MINGRMQPDSIPLDASQLVARFPFVSSNLKKDLDVEPASNFSQNMTLQNKSKKPRTVLNLCHGVLYSLIHPIKDDDHAASKNQFTAYSLAYNYFNEKLFGGTLPRCLLNFSRKDKRVLGFFLPNCWESNNHEAHEISLNPELVRRLLKAVMSILVHEMCHLWQRGYGKPVRAAA